MNEASSKRRLAAAKTLAIMAACVSLANSGCTLLHQQILLRMQAQQIANSRLTVLAGICIAALPIALWSGLVWGTKTISLRSWWVLLTVECVLFAIFASAKAYLQ